MKKAKRILFISYDGMTDPLGQSQVIPYLEGLSKAGYDVFILSCEKKKNFQKNGEAIKQHLQKLNIRWKTLMYTSKPPVLSTVYDLIRLKNVAIKLCRQQGIKMIHTRPGIPALVGLWVKNKTGVKFLNDIREFYADSRVDGKMWNIKNPVYRIIYRYFKSKEAEAIAKSDGIVCLTHQASKIISSQKEYNNTIPLKVIPCSTDLDLFNPASIDELEKDKWRQKLGISPDDLVITYLGSVGGWYLVDEMMRFCKNLSEKIPNLKILFISPHRHEMIIKTGLNYGIPENKIIVQSANRAQVPLLLSLSNYSIFFIKPCFSKLSSSPTKHGEIMAMGIPLITNPGVGDMEDLTNLYQSGILVKEFSDRIFNETTDKIASGLIFKKEQIRNAAVEYYSLGNAVKSYGDIYQEILGV